MISQKITSEQLFEAQKILSSLDRFVILTHMSPDGDAMGSSLAMYHYLHSLGKEATVIVPNAFPSFLAWMPGAQDDVIYEADREKADSILNHTQGIIVTDLHEIKRLGALGDKVMSLLSERPDMPLMMIDHHIVLRQDPELVSRPDYLLISYPDSPSASELIYRLITSLSTFVFERQRSFVFERSGLSTDIATAIYTGMMTDTGNFSFNSNYPEMYEIVGELVRAGVDKDAVYNAVFNQYSEYRMRLMGYCLYQKMRIFPEYHTALIFLSGRELYRFHFQPGDAEGIVNLPLQIGDIYYSCFMREDKLAPHEVAVANGAKKKIKISFRSQGDRPVNTFAADYFHGGGHKNAAGGEFYGPLTEAVQTFLTHYPEYFKKD